jgi:hypothetical protein
LCPKERDLYVALGENAVIVLKDKQDKNHFSGVLTSIKQKNKVLPLDGCVWEGSIESHFYSSLQILINQTFGNQSIASFISLFWETYGLKELSYYLHIQPDHKKTSRVSRNHCAYDFFRQSLLEMNMSFTLFFDEYGESIHFMDAITPYSPPREHDEKDIHLIESRAEISGDNTSTMTLYGESHRLNFVPGEKIQWEDKPYRVKSIDIKGGQWGGFNEDNMGADELKTSLILVEEKELMVSPLSVLKHDAYFQTAVIEGPHDEAIPVDETGCYSTRYDFDIEEKDTNYMGGVQKSAILSGDNYGGDMPLHNQTSVLMALQYGRLDLPVILGAFLLLDENDESLSADNKIDTIQTESAGSFVLADHVSPPTLSLLSHEKQMGLQISEKSIQLFSKKGDMHFITGGNYRVEAEKNIAFEAKTNIKINVGGTVKKHVPKGRLQWKVGNSMYLHASDRFNLKSDTITLESQQYIKFKADKTIEWNTDKIELKAPSGKLNMTGKSLTIKVNHFSWSCGASSMVIEGGELILSAPTTQIEGLMVAISV